MISKITSPVRILASSIALLALGAGGCAGKSLECPPAETPHTTAAHVSTSDPQAGLQKKVLEEQVRTLIVERDTTKQWAQEEQQRQEAEMRLRHRRNGLEAEAWQKLDDIDPKMEDIEERLKNWNVRSPAAAQEVLAKCHVLRSRIKIDLRRVETEPDGSFESLKGELEEDLDSLWSLLQSPVIQH